MTFSPFQNRYKFQTKRTVCPVCNSSDGFAQLRDQPVGYGYCHACRHKYFPSSNDGEKHYSPKYSPLKKQLKPTPLLSPVFKSIATPLLADWLNPDRYQQNAFAIWAQRLGVTLEHLVKCSVGTESNGATIFFHKSPDGKFVWYIKRVHYLSNGRRDKTIVNGISAPKGFTTADGYTLPLYCPLAFDATKQTYLVESEKTAVLCSYFLSDYNWLACGGASGLTVAKQSQLAELIGRATVYLCFDNDPAGVNATERAVKKLTEIGVNARAKYLTELAPNAPKGFDLADWIENERTPQKAHKIAPETTENQKTTQMLIEPKLTVLGAYFQNISQNDSHALKTPIESNRHIDSSSEQSSFVAPENSEINEIALFLAEIRPNLWEIEGMDLSEGVAFLLSVYRPQWLNSELTLLPRLIALVGCEIMEKNQI